MSLEKINTIHGFRYALQVVGLFGRKRKVQSATFIVSESTVSLGEVALTKMVGYQLKEIKAKPGLRWQLCQYTTTNEIFLDENGQKLSVRGISVALGGDHSILRGTVE